MTERTNVQDTAPCTRVLTKHVKISSEGSSVSSSSYVRKHRSHHIRGRTLSVQSSTKLCTWFIRPNWVGNCPRLGTKTCYFPQCTVYIRKPLPVSEYVEICAIQSRGDSRRITPFFGNHHVNHVANGRTQVYPTTENLHSKLRAYQPPRYLISFSS